MKAEWKSATTTLMELFVMTFLMKQLRQWSAGESKVGEIDVIIIRK